MRLLRFISQQEYNTLMNEEIVYPIDTGKSWAQSIYTFPLDEYSIKDYLPVVEYLNSIYDEGQKYQYYVIIESDLDRFAIGEYTKFMFDEELPFNSDGANYRIAEKILPYYTKEQVVDIKELKNGKIQEAHIPDEDIEVRGTENWLVNDILFVIYEEIKDIPFSFAKDWIIKMYKEYPKEDRHELYLSLMNNIDELYEITMALVRDYKAQSKGKV